MKTLNYLRAGACFLIVGVPMLVMAVWVLLWTPIFDGCCDGLFKVEFERDADNGTTPI